ncbi:hypothetical protein [Pantoea rwandensis]|uniref:Uncharacterized protein n=1 Tax=Pantoea rwandensis TaxID=1076550 RepID=A0A1X1CZY5_9GAMM|nr:hypothetical protein [Pantoea rwandensis]ORM70012.1 hypothetical protein HA51_08750 [Pantoea rwandensis]
MIIILLRFDGGSTEEEHDIAHIASSIKLPVLYSTGFFFFLICTAAALATLSHTGHILMYALGDVFTCRLASAQISLKKHLCGFCKIKSRTICSGAIYRAFLT